MSDKNTGDIPPEIRGLLEKSEIGYLSVASPKGEQYSYPIAFHFAGWDVYFVTPVSSAKLRFIKANHKVSMIVDNRKLTKDAIGTLIQGDAQILTVKQLLTSILSVASTTRGFTRKYPGMLSFYAKGKELPDERKLHKYRLIRITPRSMLYWIGYKYSRCVPQRKSEGKEDESTLEAMAGLLESQSQVPEEELLIDNLWLSNLDETASKDGITIEERRIIRAFANISSKNSTKLYDVQSRPKVTAEEKAVLKKWRASSVS